MSTDDLEQLFSLFANAFLRPIEPGGGDFITSNAFIIFEFCFAMQRDATLIFFVIIANRDRAIICHKNKFSSIFSRTKLHFGLLFGGG